MKQTTFLYYLLMALIMVIVFTRCTRKLHTTRSETTTQDTQGHAVDSMNRIIRTLSDAYESLLQSTSGTEVTVTPVVTAQGMPHVLSEVTVHPDGSKTVKGGTITYRDNASVTQRLSTLRQWLVDSMNSVHKKDTTAKVVSTVTVERMVKVSVMPWYAWLIFGILAALWINERFGVVKIPLLTKL